MNNKLKNILLSLLIIILLLIAAFGIYVNDFYQADSIANGYLENDSTLLIEDNLIILPGESDRALIFYPGAKVEASAYLPILEKIRTETKMSIYLVKMPFNLAIFNMNAADSIIESNDFINPWIIGGHSLGGAMASQYASNNTETIDALILMGAYIYGDYPVEKTLTIYGSLNTSVGDKLDYDTNVVVIEGGNHAQFGNYGEQTGDVSATISRDNQQALTVEAISYFFEAVKWLVR